MFIFEDHVCEKKFNFRLEITIYLLVLKKTTVNMFSISLYSENEKSRALFKTATFYVFESVKINNVSLHSLRNMVDL